MDSQVRKTLILKKKNLLEIYILMPKALYLETTVPILNIDQM